MRQWINLVEGALKVAYHTTLVDHLENIKDTGLTPNDGTRGFWPDELPVEGKLFFSTNIQSAKYYAEQMTHVGETMILRFPLPHDQHQDLNGEGNDEFYTTKDIPTSVIEALTINGWKPLIQVEQSDFE